MVTFVFSFFGYDVIVSKYKTIADSNNVTVTFVKRFYFCSVQITDDLCFIA